MAENFYQLQKEGIFKKIIYAGDGNVSSFPDGAKVCVNTCLMCV